MLIDKQFIAMMNLLSQDAAYSELMAGRPSSKTPTKNGARLAALRKTAGLSQMQLAEAVGIPQRTISFYERDADAVPSDVLPRLADALGVSVEVLLGLEKEPKNKRGPKSKLERQFEAVSKLPQSEQQFVSKLLDRFLVSKTA